MTHSHWQALQSNVPRGLEFSYDHEHGLPGLVCPSCGPWASTGWGYPTVPLSELGAELRWTPPVPLAEYLARRRLAEELVPKGAVLQPATTLGPAKLTLEGSAPEVLVLRSWIAFFRKGPFERLHVASGGRVKAAPTRTLAEWYEVEVPAGPHIHPSSFARPEKVCEVCGRDPRGLKFPLAFNAASLLEDSTPPIFRSVDAPTRIVVSPELVPILREGGAVFEDVKVLGAGEA